MEAEEDVIMAEKRVSDSKIDTGEKTCQPISQKTERTGSRRGYEIVLRDSKSGFARNSFKKAWQSFRTEKVS